MIRSNSIRCATLLVTILIIGSGIARLNWVVQSASAQDALFIDSSSNVGIGTDNPTNALHVRRNDGTAKFLVEEGSGTEANRALMELSNNGGLAFVTEDRSESSRFAFTNINSNFVINKQGGGPKLSITGNSSIVFTDKDSSTNLMLLKANGDLVIAGTLTEGSSRGVKERVEAVEPVAVLDKLAELELVEWSYKQNDRTRHLSPTAEEFYRLFGLGSDNKHIAPKDMAGVAMAAAQQLYKRSQELSERNQQLSERNEQLRADTEALKVKMEEQKLKVENQKAALQSMRRQQTAEKAALKAELAELRILVEALATEDQYAMAEAQ